MPSAMPMRSGLGHIARGFFVAVVAVLVVMVAAFNMAVFMGVCGTVTVSVFMSVAVLSVLLAMFVIMVAAINMAVFMSVGGTVAVSMFVGVALLNVFLGVFVTVTAVRAEAVAVAGAILVCMLVFVRLLELLPAVVVARR